MITVGFNNIKIAAKKIIWVQFFQFYVNDLSFMKDDKMLKFYD